MVAGSGGQYMHESLSRLEIRGKSMCVYMYFYECAYASTNTGPDIHMHVWIYINRRDEKNETNILHLKLHLQI